MRDQEWGMLRYRVRDRDQHLSRHVVDRNDVGHVLAVAGDVSQDTEAHGAHRALEQA